ncbi:MAG: PAS domain S-box protein [Deltaproteobacteria bacterium]|nr:PAS domain S-box protein [Deltaproteobacteria bacterium]
MSALVTLLLTALQVLLDYRDLRRNLEKQLDDVGLHAQALEGSVWDFDERQVQRVLDGLVLVPEVALVQVTASDTGQRWSAGRLPAGETLTRGYPLRHADGGQLREIGRVEVVAALAPLRDQVVLSGAWALLSNALRIALVAVFMVFLIRRLVTSRLEQLAGQVRALVPRLLPAQGAPGAEPPPPELDELGEVEWALRRATDDLGRAVGALRESEARYRRIVETANEGVWLIDAENRTTFVNQRMARMLGYTPEEMLGRALFDFMDEEARAAAAAAVERRRKGVVEQHDFRFSRKDGSDAWVLIDTTPFFDEQGAYAGALGMVTDVTERRRLEEQFRQAQKLEAVARLAAGVAHDFNNLLTAMLGAAGALVEGLPSGDPRREDALEIQAAAQRAALLTRQLLAFGRRQAAQPRVLDLNEVVWAMERMLRRLIGEEIELLTHPATGLWPVRADPGQVEQVIVNLAVNARDAMTSGGRLTIETANVEPAAAASGAQAARRVRLSVRDTGCGMVPEVLEHLFEPFFTTKEAGKGTGLGLSTVHGIVKQCGGDIEVRSEPGKGTEFEVFLPAAGDTTQPAAEGPGRLPATRGTETVLVLDDEPLVRSAVGRPLRALGYRVLEAGDGEEALRALADAPGRRVDLLVTDLVLPGVGGPEVVASLRDLLPGLPVLFVSGYSDRALELERFGPRAGFLAKPFASAELTRKVRELLDA